MEELMKDPLPDMTPWDSTFDFNMDLSASTYNPSSCPTFPTTFSFNEPAFPDLNFLDDVSDMDTMPSTIIPPTPATTAAVDTAPDEPMPVVLRLPKENLASLTRIQLLRAAEELVDKRLRRAVDTFKSGPEKMVLEGGTPWSHPEIYKDSMPALLEDALAACALYRAKNTVNTSMIQRVIEQRYQKLLAAPGSTNPLLAQDVLARTHALLLYQIMLFFDESPTAQALAAETISALSDSAMTLLKFVRHETPEEEDDNSNSLNPTRQIPLYPLTAARTLYTDWTFQESMRRTMVASFILIQVQCIMRADFTNPIMRTQSPSTPTSTAPTTPQCLPLDAPTLATIQAALERTPTEECDSRLLLCRSLTLSAHLWHARDAVDFAVAWREKKHLVAQPWTIWKQLERAMPDDIDELGRMLMCAGMGIEETRGWFMAKGGKL